VFSNKKKNDQLQFVYNSDAVYGNGGGGTCPAELLFEPGFSHGAISTYDFFSRRSSKEDSRANSNPKEMPLSILRNGKPINCMIEVVSRSQSIERIPRYKMMR
jgi:hypothetical protein